jgi:large subunit ribosomal protein L10
LQGAFLAKEDVSRLSDLPSREVLLAKLLSLMQSPATKLAYILNAKSRDLLSILKQYSEKKGGS